MIVGFVGAGSMAGAMARGWRGEVDSMLFTDSGSGRARELAKEVGGEAIESNLELAERAELLILAVKPSQLDGVARELQAAKAVMSLLGATSLHKVQVLFPSAEVCRVMPNVAVEVKKGVLCVAGLVSDKTRELLAELGNVVDLDDSEFDAATAVMACAPAYLALAVEAIADAGAHADLNPDLARDLVVDAAVGTAALMKNRRPAYVRKAVASPGGSTEAGLEALKRADTRAAFAAAVRASLERMRG
jgi:pyrroline-5-carboxylate reductase